MIRKQQEFWGKLVIFTGISLIFASFMLALSPRFSFLGRLISAKDLTLMVTQYRMLPNFSFLTRFGFAFVIFAIASIMVSMATVFLSHKVREDVYSEMETALFASFISGLRFCYTRENLIEAIQRELEYQADCSVLLTNTDTDLVVYNSASAYVSDPDVYAKLAQRFSTDWLEHWGEGIYLLVSSSFAPYATELAKATKAKCSTKPAAKPECTAKKSATPSAPSTRKPGRCCSPPTIPSTPSSVGFSRCSSGAATRPRGRRPSPQAPRNGSR